MDDDEIKAKIERVTPSASQLIVYPANDIWKAVSIVLPCSVEDLHDAAELELKRGKK